MRERRGRGWWLMWTATACFAGGDDLQPPRIGAIEPADGASGSRVQLRGDHFCPVPDPPDGEQRPTLCDGAGGSVRFGPTVATTSSWSDGSIDADVPILPPGNVDVTVTVAGRTSQPSTFEVRP